MTVTYTHKVANARLGGFSSLLIRWKGSVYKLFYREFFIYIALYVLLSLLYRFVLQGSSKVYFEKLCIQFHHYTDLIPISFVLGFYVSIVVGRWWSQFENIPWPDRLMIIIGSNVHGVDDRGRLIRRTLVRYLNLAQVLTYRSVSTAVYKRFPTIRHVVDAGIMTGNEHEQFESAKTANLKYWIPLLWFSNLLTKVRQEGRIYDDMTFNLIIKELNTFRSCCGQLINYDWISVPLVYTQVVTVAVYMFFMSTLLSRQFLDTEQKYKGHEVDLYVPLFTIGQFFFYMGWLKVAEQLINPFGEDDDDFEVNWCIDRNVEVSMIAVDKLYGKHPKLEKDKFWNDVNPVLPYTAASVSHKIEPFMGSTFDMSINKEDMQLTPQVSNETRRIGKSTLKIFNKERGNLSSYPQLVQSTQTKQPASVPLLLYSGQKRVSNDTTPSVSSDDSSDDDSHHTVIQMQQKRTSMGSREFKTLFDSDVENNNVKPTTIRDVTLQDDAKDILTSQLSAEEMATNRMHSTNASPKQQESPLFIRRSYESSRKNRGGGLRLDLSAISNQRYLEAGFCAETLPQNDETIQERKNAEKRSYLASRRRKFRNAIPPRKRTRRSESGYSLWLRRQQRKLSEVHPGGGDAMFSESDIGSGPTTDSPFGSMMSCTTSIPSPKQLRWAFRSKTVNVYGDNTSATSSVPSPSGTEGLATDSATSPPLGMNWLNGGDSRSGQNNPLLQDNSSLTIGRGNSHASSGREETITPFTDDLRKRLQIVSLSSPAPASPLTGRHQKITNNSSSYSSSKPQLSSKTKTMKRHAEVLKKQLKEFKAGKSQKSHNLSQNLTKLSAPVSDGPASKHKISSLENDPLLCQRIHQATQTIVPNETRKNSSGIWNALKTWKTKKKEVKERNRDEFLLLPKAQQQMVSIGKQCEPHNVYHGNRKERKPTTANFVVTNFGSTMSKENSNTSFQFLERPAASEKQLKANDSLPRKPEVFGWEHQDCTSFKNDDKTSHLLQPPQIGNNAVAGTTDDDDDEIVRSKTNLYESTTNLTTTDEKYSATLTSTEVQVAHLRPPAAHRFTEAVSVVGQHLVDISDESHENEIISHKPVKLCSIISPAQESDFGADNKILNVVKTSPATFCDSFDNTTPEELRSLTGLSQSSVLIVDETTRQFDETAYPPESLQKDNIENMQMNPRLNSFSDDVTISFLPQDGVEQSCLEASTFGLAIIPEIASDDEKSIISSQDLDKSENV